MYENVKKETYLGGQRIPTWNTECDKIIQLYLKYRNKLTKGGGEKRY